MINASHGQEITLECRIIHANGQQRWVSILFVQQLDEKKQLRVLQAFVEDISQFKDNSLSIEPRLFKKTKQVK